MSSHSPGALHAAKVIANSRKSIATSDGEKRVGELADLIEEKTRIVELIDAAERLVRSAETETGTLEAAEGDLTRAIPSKRIEELNRALAVVLDDAAARAGGRTDTH